MTLPKEKMQVMTRMAVEQSTLAYTRYFFRELYGKKFVVSTHHQQICDLLDRIIRGEVKKAMINIAPRYGKAIDAYTPMLTPDGWKYAGDIEVGDYLFGRNGQPTKVLGVYPQGVTDAYQVTFSDKTTLVTCGEHLWSLNHRELSRKDGFTFKQVRKTKELIGTLKANDGHKQWHIPTCDPLVNSEKDLPIDPYLFGAWLGDGSSYKAEMTTMDEDIIHRFSAYGVTVRTCQNAGKATEYGIKGGFITRLKQLGVIGNKHIPDKYMLGSYEQRLELLRGLCDTDGTCNKKSGQVSFCATKIKLLNDVKRLIVSLGGIYTEYRHSLFFKLKDCPFHLERKKQHWKPLTAKHFTKRFIESIDRVSDRETVCFTVDADDHLFLAGDDLICTHNTELAVKNFISHGLGLNPASRYIHLSYSDDLALDNSEGIKSIVEHESYQTVFPEVVIKKDSRAKKKWYTTAGGGVYATSTAGQVTGFGAGQVDEEDETGSDSELDAELDAMLTSAGINRGFGGALVIDDPIKPEDADSEERRNRINARYDSTIKNRVNSRNTPIIIIMQRVHENDLCGYLLQNEPGEWEVLSLPCIQEDSNGGQYALWPFKHTLDELMKLKAQNGLVFERQYMQNPTPAGGYLYAPFKTYHVLPTAKRPLRKNYTDTADEGKDYLCSIDFEEHETGMYVLDVLYTQFGMETTEEQAATMLSKDVIDFARVESNNGGRGWARNVERILRIKQNLHTRIEWFHQSGNKHSRIFTNAPLVHNLIYMPEGWHLKWPKFHQHVTQYLAAGKNAHDDAPDCLTGMVEFFRKDAVSTFAFA